MKLTKVLAVLMPLGFVALAAKSSPSVSPRALSDSSPVEEVPVHNDQSSPPSSPGFESSSLVGHSLHNPLEVHPPSRPARKTEETIERYDKKFEECPKKYADDQVFHGILPDTGAACGSCIGREQFKALQRSNPEITLDRTKGGDTPFRFGNGPPCKPVGLARVDTPLGKMELHVLPASLPAILSYDDMRALRLEVRHRPSTRLVKVDERGNVLAETRLNHEWGRPWYRPSEEKCVTVWCSSAWLPFRSSRIFSSITGHPEEAKSVHPNARTTPPEVRSIGPPPPKCPKNRLYSADDKFFYGIVPDIGSSGHSSVGLPQLQALQRLKPEIMLDRTTAGSVSVKFGAEDPCVSIGSTHVKTRFGQMEFHVLPAPLPALLSYPDMKNLGLELRHSPSHRFVKVNGEGKIVDEVPLDLHYGHPSYRYPWDCEDQPGRTGRSQESTDLAWSQGHRLKRIRRRDLAHAYHHRLKIRSSSRSSPTSCSRRLVSLNNGPAPVQGPKDATVTQNPVNNLKTLPRYD